jgi:succinate dehydrogenase/fumarate reductase flavoprotein subunit
MVHRSEGGIPLDAWESYQALDGVLFQIEAVIAQVRGKHRNSLGGSEVAEVFDGGATLGRRLTIRLVGQTKDVECAFERSSLPFCRRGNDM